MGRGGPGRAAPRARRRGLKPHGESRSAGRGSLRVCTEMSEVRSCAGPRRPWLLHPSQPAFPLPLDSRGVCRKNWVAHHHALIKSETLPTGYDVSAGLSSLMWGSAPSHQLPSNSNPAANFPWLYCLVGSEGIHGAAPRPTCQEQALSPHSASAELGSWAGSSPRLGPVCHHVLGAAVRQPCCIGNA